jgi:hypothetical protein
VKTSNLTTRKHFEGFEVFTAVNMKSAAFWDVTLWGSCVNRCHILEEAPFVENTSLEFRTTGKMHKSCDSER